MNKNSVRLYCFSPPAMLAIFSIELGLAFYTLFKYKLNNNTRLITIILILLAFFQLSEYHVCGQDSDSSLIWTRIGFVSITMLPPLGLHLIYKIVQRKAQFLVKAAYALGFCFVLVFGLSNSAFSSHICSGNYTIFSLISPLGGYYFAYYYSLLFIGIGLSLYFSIGANIKTQKALILQVFGYLSFLLPTGIINTINPDTISGIPSIMCGFAVIYALILVFGILPIIKTNENGK